MFMAKPRIQDITLLMKTKENVKRMMRTVKGRLRSLPTQTIQTLPNDFTCRKKTKSISIDGEINQRYVREKSAIFDKND